MQKAEAERAIRHLCHEWRRITGKAQTSEGELSFGEFLAWVRSNYPGYLDFRSRAGATYDVELWFDQEFRQAWKR